MLTRRRFGFYREDDGRWYVDSKSMYHEINKVLA